MVVGPGAQSCWLCHAGSRGLAIIGRDGRNEPVFGVVGRTGLLRNFAFMVGIWHGQRDPAFGAIFADVMCLSVWIFWEERSSGSQGEKEDRVVVSAVDGNRLLHSFAFVVFGEESRPTFGVVNWNQLLAQFRLHGFFEKKADRHLAWLTRTSS